MAIEAPPALTKSEWHVPREMGVAQVYAHLVRARWHLPQTFRVDGDGARRWNRRGRAVDAWEDDVRAVYAGIRHPAVPRFMSDRALKVAIGQEFCGPRFFEGASAARAKCRRCQEAETTEHRYCQCAEVRQLWKLVLSTWRRMSGERLDPADDWITAWGLRRVTWTDEKDQAAYGGADREEVFQVLHKATIQAIHEEAQRLRPRKACHMYRRVQNLVHSMVADRRRDGSARS